MSSLTLRLDYPPSVNHYWRTFRGRMIISREGRTYRERVYYLVHVQHAALGLKARLRVTIHAHMPDRRRRDLDNLGKALMDSMKHAGVYEDDSLIDDLRIIRCKPDKGGYVEVQIETMEEKA